MKNAQHPQRTMDFDQRLAKAVERGQHRSEQKAAEAAARALSEQQCKQLHTQYRLELSEHIESCLEKLSEHFPGFRYETVVGEKGWGAVINRDTFAGLFPMKRRIKDGKHLLRVSPDGKHTDSAVRIEREAD